MKLQDVAKKPQLTLISLDDDDTVQRYGEAVEFYVYDRYPMETYLKLMQLEEDNIGNLSKVVQDLILDENGKTLDPDILVPFDLMPKIINTVVGQLGNLQPQTSTT